MGASLGDLGNTNALPLTWQVGGQVAGAVGSPHHLQTQASLQEAHHVAVVGFGVGLCCLVLPLLEGCDWAECLLSAFVDQNCVAVTVEVVFIAQDQDYKEALVVVDRDRDIVEVGKSGCGHSQCAQDAQEGDELGPGPGGRSVGTPLVEEGSEVQKVESLTVVDGLFCSVVDQCAVQVLDEWVVHWKKVEWFV